jgi:hypothetical protein
MSFPALRTIGGGVKISGTPAVDSEKGIEMPKLRRVHGVQVVGRAPHCEGLARQTQSRPAVGGLVLVRGEGEVDGGGDGAQTVGGSDGDGSDVGA